jgi:predicted small secreted protein
MQFILGYIAGLVTAALVVAVLAYFKRPIQQALDITEKVLETAGPRSKGYIFEPEDDAEVARQEIVARNAEKGRDTPISELL